MATRRRIHRPHLGTRRPPADQAAPTTTPFGNLTRLARYITDGVPSHAPTGTTIQDALDFAATDDAKFSMLLYATPSQDVIDELTDAWDLHPLLVEDLIKGRQRPKLERYRDVIFLVARSAWYVDQTETVEFAEFHILLRRDAVVVLCQDGCWIDGTDVTNFDSEEDVARLAHAGRLLGDPELLKLGPGAVAYKLVDHIVDGFIPVLEGLAEDKDQIERQVFSGDAAAAERIYRLSQEVIDLKQAIGSLSSVVAALMAGFERYSISVGLQAYLGDLSDHLARVDAEVIEMRDALTQILSVNSTLVAQRQNEDMKKISGWAAILFAPTLIGAIYGMNFVNMPGLNFSWGYPVALLAMVALSVALYLIFRSRKWM